MRFIDNAHRYGHKLDCVIVAHTHVLDQDAAKSIDNRVPLITVDIKNPSFCAEQFRCRGISEASAKALLSCPVDTSRGIVPYGFKRTIVTIEAILRGVDVLFFIDSDIYPSVLKMMPAGPSLEDTDFFGAHLESLNSGSAITTGEYSGYNILPPAAFDGMEDLLHGLQKSDMLEYWRSSERHRCLAVQPPERRPVPCTKILGGNTAITLSTFKKLPPFFSSHYSAGGELFLGRGEDTLLGSGIEKKGITCTDVGLNPLHDTYKSFPSEPDLRRSLADQERFFYACAGWVGRNPLFNYVWGNDLRSVREFQREKLERGLPALAEYTSNPRFQSILDNFDVSWDNLGRYINEYELVIEAWDEFISRSGLA
jgi:hypothetical protein